MSEWMPVFSDDKLNEKLRKEGIVKFNLASVEMAKACEKKLRSLIPDYDRDIGEHFYGSVSLSEKTIKEAVHREMSALLTPYLASILEGHKLLTYFYLVKVVGDKSELKIHQDWSIVDERSYRAYNLWIPLTDSTVQNGTIYALKGSHQFPLNIRGANIPPKYLEHYEVAKQQMEAIEVKLGEALIFDSRLIHFSPPNQSASPRTAVINNIIPKKAETYSFCGEESNGQLKVKQYRVPEDLFIHYDDFVHQKDLPNPVGSLVGYIDYANTASISEKSFKALMNQHGLRKKWYQFF